MSSNGHTGFSRRERLLLDLIYRFGKASAGDIHAALNDGTSYSTVRAQLRILEEKGAVRHEEDGVRYIYFPVVPREKAGRSAVSHLLKTFFDDSPERLVAALLDRKSTELNPEELDRIAALIDKARQRGDKS